ncbi:USF2 family protein [Megaselia abdita]
MDAKQQPHYNFDFAVPESSSENNLVSDNVFLTIVDPKDQEDDDSGNCQFIVVRNVEPKSSTISRKPTQISHKLIDIKREEKRRVTHNEVERRRRVKINNWIGQLKELMDGRASSVDTHTSSDSKSQILVKACDYIKDINMQLERLTEENSKLREENALLQSKLIDSTSLDNAS